MRIIIPYYTLYHVWLKERKKKDTTYPAGGVVALSMTENAVAGVCVCARDPEKKDLIRC